MTAKQFDTWYCANCDCEFDPETEGKVQWMGYSGSKCNLLIDGRSHSLVRIAWATVQKIREANETGRTLTAVRNDQFNEDKKEERSKIKLEGRKDGPEINNEE